MRGLPDWNDPRPSGPAPAWSAYDMDGLSVAMPDDMAVDRDTEGRPLFRLLAVRAAVPRPDRPNYGRLDATFRLISRLADAAGGTRVAPPARAWWRFDAGALGGDGPARQLDAEGLAAVRLSLPLDAQGVDLIQRALLEGTLALSALASFEIVGVSARCAGRATIDIVRLRQALAGGLTGQALADLLAADPGALGTLSGVSADTPKPVLAAALADHIRARLCSRSPTPLPDGRLALTLDTELTAATSGEAAFDLDEPVATARDFVLALDPIASARSLLAPGAGTETLVSRLSSDGLQSGRHELSIDFAVPVSVAGPLSIGASLSLPARPPVRPRPVQLDVEKPDDGTGLVRTVQLSPVEDLAWTVTGFSIWPARPGADVERVGGPARQGTGAAVLLRPTDLGLTVTVAEAGAALLRLARVEVTLSGLRPTPRRVMATLDVATPRVALALPNDCDAASLSVALVALGDGRRIDLPSRSTGEGRIELADVPGYGPRSLEISVSFGDGAASLIAIEVLAEDAVSGSEPDTYAFTPAAPSRIHRWLCQDPFRPGLMWRWRTDPPPPFSTPVRGVGRLELTTGHGP